MKRFILLITTYLFISGSAIGQEKGAQHLQINTGAFTTHDLFFITSDLVDVLVSVPLGLEYGTTETTPYFGITYNRAIKNNINVNINAGYQGSKKKLELNKKHVGTIDRKIFTVAIGANASYVNSKYFRMYSGISLGYSFADEGISGEISKGAELEPNSSIFNAHVNALGLRFGDKIAGTLELGFGYKGILNVGLDYKF